MNFKDYFRGVTPQWNPAREYHVLHDIETGSGIKMSWPEKKKVIYILIPFCVVGYTPRYKSKWGIEDAELHEIYPFAEFNEETRPSAPEMVVPYTKNKMDELKYATTILRSKHNVYAELQGYPQYKPVINKIYSKCWDAAEQWIQDYANMEDPDIHPHDPDYDPN